MEDENLIECVRKYPAIYDLSNNKYLDSNYKSYVWKLISEELKETDVTCKKRWINIRDRFRKSLIRRKTKGGQVSDIKKYKYEEDLQFLVPHIQERNAISSIVQPQNDWDKVNSQIMRYAANETLEQITTSSSTCNSDFPPDETPRKKRKTVPSESPSSAFMNYLIGNNKDNNECKHPIDAFLQGLAPTLKNLPPYYQHLAKGKIFSVVHELEGQALFAAQYQPGTPHTSDSSWE